MVKLWQRLDGHSHYVQGVALDPLNKFLLSQSCDRTVAIRTLLTDKGCVCFGLSVHRLLLFAHFAPVLATPRPRTSSPAVFA